MKSYSDYVKDIVIEAELKFQVCLNFVGVAKLVRMNLFFIGLIDQICC